MQAIEELEKALEHLDKAIQKLRDTPETRRIGRARRDALIAAGYTIGAQWQLRQEKEE